MGYRNILISALDDALRHVTEARAMVSDERFNRKDFDVGAFLVECSQATSDIGDAIVVAVEACGPIKPIDEVALTMRVVSRAAKGDPLDIGSDPELLIASVAAAFVHYRLATKDPDTTMRFTEARDHWLKVLDSFATWERFPPMARYCFLVEWRVSALKDGKLFDDDEAEIARHLAALKVQLYGPERHAVEALVESIKHKNPL